MSSREQWEEVSFQVINEMDGSVRSGYFPTGEGLVSGNVKTDYVFGNFPLQPNDDRAPGNTLGIGDSHKLNAMEWNSYPDVRDNRPVGSRNYMVTAAQYIGSNIYAPGDNIYEFTSQNNLKVGDDVRTTNCPGFNGTATVVYADATKFRTNNEHDGSALITGLRGRVDVLNDNTGDTLEGGGVFFWPELWFCNTGITDKNLSAVINEFVSYGVPREYFKDMTFNGGVDEWDASDDDPNWDGCILYTYIPAEIWLGNDWLGRPIYGSDFDNKVIGGNYGGGNESDIDTGYPEDYMLLVASNDPRKNNAEWWFN